MTAIKRIREEDREVEALAMANCLMLLSRVGQTSSSPSSFDRIFECKTCNRKFPSFQALGGHRASHKRPKFDHDAMPLISPVKPKTHECSICGVEFAIGQALGGHMRRHRAAEMKEHKFIHTKPMSVSVSVPVLKRSNSKRIMSLNLNLNLDLNLTPYENDLKLAPVFTPFF